MTGENGPIRRIEIRPGFEPEFGPEYGPGFRPGATPGTAPERTCCRGSVDVLAAPLPSVEPEEACRLLSPVLDRLSEEQRRAISANRRPVDRALRLLVRALWAFGLKEAGEDPDQALADLRFDGRGRPFYKVAEFNFSHCAPYGVCALAPPGWPGGLGVDVERARPLEADDFRRVFAPDELRAVAASADPDGELIRRWTVKEAVLKALGDGFLADPRPIPTEPAAEGRRLAIRLDEGQAAVEAIWRRLDLDFGFSLTAAAAGVADFRARLRRPEPADYLGLFA
ncbi:MAG: 4'-phosphopantetheinyl transferase superfamily protein [Deltaproteobacteria bacterium]|jgi:4'-phosphopantetheinyl transferase|nr:4'-phosphopantetheinyl transferase superfamily protein [Deltaproteobacteria bacterium]